MVTYKVEAYFFFQSLFFLIKLQTCNFIKKETPT